VCACGRVCACAFVWACLRACVRVRVRVRVCVYTCACVCASACVCACSNVMCLCACTYAGVCQRGGVRVSVCVFPFYLQYFERNKCHCLSLTTSGGCSCLFGSGTSRLNAMMFQTCTYMGICMRICMCVCKGACLHRCMYMSRTHNIHIHAHTTDKACGTPTGGTNGLDFRGGANCTRLAPTV